jgi:hypothetical protein
VFLKRKGLTDVEVDHACEKAGAFSDDENNNVRISVHSLLSKMLFTLFVGTD